MNKKQIRILCGSAILIGLLLIFGTVYVALGADNNMNNINEKGGRPPEMSDNKNNTTPPTNDQNNNSNNDAKSEWSIPNNNQKNEMPSVNNNSKTFLSFGQVALIVFGTCLVVFGIIYLIFSKFGDIKIFINKDKAIIYILLSLLVTILLSYAELTFINKKLLDNNTSSQTNQTIKSSNTLNGNA